MLIHVFPPLPLPQRFTEMRLAEQILKKSFSTWVVLLFKKKIENARSLNIFKEISCRNFSRR